MLVAFRAILVRRARIVSLIRQSLLPARALAKFVHVSWPTPESVKQEMRECKERVRSKYIVQSAFWRRGWDSNPRYGRTVNQISSLAHSTTLPPLRCAASGEVYPRDVLHRSQDFGSVDVGTQCGGHHHTAVSFLIVLEHRNQRPADRKSRAI